MAHIELYPGSLELDTAAAMAKEARNLCKRGYENGFHKQYVNNSLERARTVYTDTAASRSLLSADDDSDNALRKKYPNLVSYYQSMAQGRPQGLLLVNMLEPGWNIHWHRDTGPGYREVTIAVVEGVGDFCYRDVNDREFVIPTEVGDQTRLYNPAIIGERVLHAVYANEETRISVACSFPVSSTV